MKLEGRGRGKRRLILWLGERDGDTLMMGWRFYLLMARETQPGVCHESICLPLVTDVATYPRELNKNYDADIPFRPFSHYLLYFIPFTLNSLASPTGQIPPLLFRHSCLQPKHLFWERECQLSWVSTVKSSARRRTVYPPAMDCKSSGLHRPACHRIKACRQS